MDFATLIIRGIKFCATVTVILIFLAYRMEKLEVNSIFYFITSQLGAF